MSSRALILGVGGHARVLVDALRLLGAEICGLADPRHEELGGTYLGLPVFSDDDVLSRHAPDGVELVNGLGSVGDSSARRRLGERFERAGYRFRSVVHPAAIVGRDVELSAGAQVMAGAVIQPGCRIGPHAIINTSAAVDHDCTVGEHAHVAPGAILCGDVRIGARAHVGAGAVVIQGLRVGEDALVGAGAVVVRDVEPGARVLGVPARGADG